MSYTYAIENTEQTARKNIESFYDSFDMPGGYSFNHVERLQTIDLYYNSQFKTGNIDELGLRKFFFNIVKPASDIATKFIDLDTKDIILNPDKPEDELRVWIMQKKLKQYLKEAEFGLVLNDIAFNLPKYGRVVLKKDFKRRWNLVNIQNLRFNPSVKCLEDSEFVYELIAMSRSEIRKAKWNEDAIKELFGRGYDQSFHIYECYDKTEKGWVRTIRGDLFSSVKAEEINRTVESEINEQNDYYGSITLFTETVKKLPYRDDFIWEKVPGRWLGYGFVEYLEENQIATNEAENLERKGLAISSLQLLQSSDENIAGQNVLANARNGDIIKVDSPLTKVDLAERNLAAYNSTRANWNGNTERKTFTSDITTGASLPSRTPLGVANLQASLASSYFELKRENYGLALKKLIEKDIIPDFEKDTDEEHTLTFFGSDEDLEKLDKLFTKRIMDDAILDYASKHGYFPSREEKDRVRAVVESKLRGNKNRYVGVMRSAYRNAKYIVDVNITGESIDNGARSQLIQLAMQMMGTNPALIQNPLTRRAFFAFLSLGGVNPIELGLNDIPVMSEQQMQGQMMQPGGSVSLGTPVQGSVETQNKI